MAIRALATALGRYEFVHNQRANLYFPRRVETAQNTPERLGIFGEEGIGGKGEGLVFALAHRESLGYQIPLTIAIGRERTMLESVGLKQISTAAQLIGIEPPLAVRSSSFLEDRKGFPAAGVFSTRVCGNWGLDLSDPRSFIRQMQEVVSSADSPRAYSYYKFLGIEEIPPMAIIIQELIGKEWKFIPGIFFPAYSGIINTASLQSIKISFDIGFGVNQVGNKGTGALVVYDKTTLNVKDKQPRFPEIVSYYDHQVELLQEMPEIYDHIRRHFDTLNYNMLRGLGDKQNLINRLAVIARKLERIAGYPLDIEWASPDGKQIYLLQVRPIAPKIIREDPPSQVKKILDTREVIGQGTMTFDHILVINDPFPKGNFPDYAVMERIRQQAPNCLIVYQCKSLDRIFSETMWRLFPYAKAVCIVEENACHDRGIGIQHIALCVHSIGRVILYSPNRIMKDRLIASGKPLPTYGESPNGETSKDERSVKLYSLPSLHLYADDERKRAFIYR